MLERCLYLMVNEGARILEEGKPIRGSDIDVIWRNGYGSPVYRGGPMLLGGHGRTGKLAAKKMAEYEARMGEAYKPAKLLEEKAA